MQDGTHKYQASTLHPERVPEASGQTPVVPNLLTVENNSITPIHSNQDIPYIIANPFRQISAAPPHNPEITPKIQQRREIEDQKLNTKSPNPVILLLEHRNNTNLQADHLDT